MLHSTHVNTVLLLCGPESLTEQISQPTVQPRTSPTCTALCPGALAGISELSLKLAVPTLRLPGLRLIRLLCCLEGSLVVMVQISFEVPPKRNMLRGDSLASCLHFHRATTGSRVFFLIKGLQENCPGHSSAAVLKYEVIQMLSHCGSEWLSGSKDHVT